MNTQHDPTTPDPTAYEHEGYFQFAEYEAPGVPPLLYGSFQVFWLDQNDIEPEEGDEPYTPGWYWRACFPGCLPDGDPAGPFDTSTEAYEDAQDI